MFQFDRKGWFSTFFLALLFLLPFCAGKEPIPKTYTSGSFIVEEYPLNRRDPFVIPRQFLEKRNPWRVEPEESFDVEEINRMLQPQGYRLARREGSSLFAFYRNNNLLAEQLADITHFSMGSKKKNFILFARQYDGTNEVLWRFRNDTAKKINRLSDAYWNYSLYRIYPFFIGDTLTWCELTDRGFASWEGIVRNSSGTLYSFDFVFGAGGLPIRFKKVGESWVLLIMEFEKSGRVIIDGADLSKRYNVAGIWEYTLIHGKPFFIFNRSGDNRRMLWYGDREVGMLWYDYIGYDGEWGVQANEDMAWFFAERNGQSYYVEAGVYNDPQYP